MLINPKNGGPPIPQWTAWGAEFAPSPHHLKQAIKAVAGRIAPADATTTLLKAIEYIVARKPSATLDELATELDNTNDSDCISLATSIREYQTQPTASPSSSHNPPLTTSTFHMTLGTFLENPKILYLIDEWGNHLTRSQLLLLMVRPELLIHIPLSGQQEQIQSLHDLVAYIGRTEPESRTIQHLIDALTALQYNHVVLMIQKALNHA